MFHSKDIKEPAKNEAISANLMLRMPENVHIVQIVQTDKVYEMKTKSKKHKNMIETHISALT